MKFVAFATVGVFAAGVAHAQMTLPGKFEVTDTGSASYTIPISIAPGTAGLEPKLSLQYDSRSGNGLLGVGWSLAGLPAITRCGRTIAQDGQAGGVAYDANDRFCLDGQRLIATSGTYGADQTEYRTERESFSKVVSYGTAGSGPSWFKVWTKAGLIMEFGNTADSRIEAQGKSSIRVWAINKTSDTKGNYFTVGYIEDIANGEYRPDRIDYTGNATVNTQLNNSVRFVYETRPDIVPLYQAGSLVKTSKRMTKVQAWQGTNMLREYRLTYQVPASAAYSRAIGIELCAPESGCIARTALEWDAEVAQQFGTPMITQSGPGYGSGYTISFADFNGDGVLDSVMHQMATQWYVFVALGKGDGTFHTATAWYGPPQGSGYKIAFADFNGDGRADAVAYKIESGWWTMQVALGNGDGSFTAPVTTQSGPGYGSGYTISFADFNGDGVLDSVMHQMATQWYVFVALGKGDGTFHTATAWYGPPQGSGYTIALADFNGDGRADLIAYKCTGGIWSTAVAMGRGDGGFDPPVPWTSGPGWGENYIISVADFNGDGLQDLTMYQSVNSWWYVQIVLGHGDGSFGPVQSSYSGPGWGGGYSTAIADFNGDGRTDMTIHQMATQWYIFPALGRGDGTLDTVGSYYGPNLGSGYSLSFGDFNGDGRADAIAYKIESGWWTMHVALSTSPDQRIKRLVTGPGSTTAIQYLPLSQKNQPIYVKDTGGSACAYPCVDVQGPLYVVSEVRSSNGLGIAGAGGEYRSTYRYAGAKADQQGRGFLGFRQMTVKDEQTGVEQTTTYRQDYPFTGLVASREKKLGAQLLNRSSNTYGSTDLGGTRRYPFLTASLEESWELTGAALPAVTTAYQYDAFGNATQVGVSTGDGHAKVTNNTYSNDAANWLLGRLTRSEVTSTTPGN
jgi:hypothetical protein